MRQPTDFRDSKMRLKFRWSEISILSHYSEEKNIYILGIRYLVSKFGKILISFYFITVVMLMMNTTWRNLEFKLVYVKI